MSRYGVFQSKGSSTQSASGGKGGYYASFQRPRATGKPKTKGPSIWDRIKRVGGTALDVLTVPGAVVATGINAATGGDVEWSDLGGSFTNKDGRGAGYKLAKRFGAGEKTAKMVGLGLEIAVDPLTYATGGLSASAKTTAGAARLSKMAELKQLEGTARNIIGPGAGRAVLRAKGVPAGLSPAKVAELAPVIRRANAVRRELETMGGVPSLRLGVGKKAVDVGVGHPLAAASTKVRVGRGIEVRFGRKTRLVKDPLKGGLLRQSAVARELHRNKRALTDLAAISESLHKGVIAAHNVTPEELAYVREYVALKAEPIRKGGEALGRTGPKQAEALRRSLVEDGRWRPELDALAEVYRNTDREIADAAGLVVYADQVKAFEETVAGASAKAADLEAAKARELAEARTAFTAAKQAALDAERPAAAERVASLGAVVDELKIAAARNPDDVAVAKRLRSTERQLEKAKRSAEGIGTVASRRADAAAWAAQSAKIEAKYADAIRGAWDDAGARFAEAARAGGYAADWRVGKSKAPDLRSLEDVAAKLASVDGHYTANVGPETMDAVTKYRAAQLSQGVSEIHLKTAFDARGIPDTLQKREFASPTNWVTQKRYVENLVKEGVPEHVAVRMSEVWQNLGAKFAKGDQFFPKTTVPLQPDVDFFRVQRGAAYGRQLDALEDYTKSLIAELAPEGATADVVQAMIRDVTGRWEDVSKQLPTSMRRVFTAKRGPAAGESRFAIATTWLKMWYTNFNPIAHYVLNASGSFLNSLFHGNRYHFSRGLIGAFGFSTRKLGKLDPAVMDKVHKIGDTERTGLELLTLSAISGLGAPYSKAEIANVVNLIGGTKEGKARWLARHLNDFQMDRENADRLYSFMNHLRGGDDMFTAGSKVVRYAFDYDQLTAFEKVWLRNLMIFYTWFRKNMAFQGYGLLTRPGIHAALADVEQYRPKNPGEPEWWSKAGGIGTPMGLLTFGNPYADIFKYSADLGDARRTVLAAVNPFIRVPAEITLDKNTFTGRPIGDSAWSKLGHIGTTVGGPQLKTVQAIGKGDPVDIAGRILGPKIQRTDDAGNANRLARSEAAARGTDPVRSAAAKKAAETRKKNQLERYRDAQAAGRG